MSDRNGRPLEAARRGNVLLIDQCTMTRECLAHALNTISGFCLRSAESLCDLEEKLSDWSPGVVLLNVHSGRIDEPHVIAMVKDIQRVVPGVPIAAISDRCDLSLAHLAIQRGYFGYITTAMHPDLLVGAILLILTGGTFVARELLLQTKLPGPLPARTEPVKTVLPAPAHITKREGQVLNLLREGKQNKVIAHELQISESTVKLHVHQIMRKLSATNRTHVAALGAIMPQ